MACSECCETGAAQPGCGHRHPHRPRHTRSYSLGRLYLVTCRYERTRGQMSNKRMQLAGASILKETSACAQAGKSPQLMRGPLDCSLAHAIMRLKILVLTGLLPCSGCG